VPVPNCLLFFRSAASAERKLGGVGRFQRPITLRVLNGFAWRRALLVPPKCARNTFIPCFWATSSLGVRVRFFLVVGVEHSNFKILPALGHIVEFPVRALGPMVVRRGPVNFVVDIKKKFGIWCLGVWGGSWRF
jgi:hypothetical protein